VRDLVSRWPTTWSRRRTLPLGPFASRTANGCSSGDAGGRWKPTGGGIYYSIISGMIAADVLAQGPRPTPCRPTTCVITRPLAPAPSPTTAQSALRFIAEDARRRHDALPDLARTDGVLPIVWRTARSTGTVSSSRCWKQPARRVTRRLTGFA
jgi:flavin-dependent dehydrogenase